MTDITQKQKKHITGIRVMAIITGILLIILGILFFVFPHGLMLFTEIFITIGLLIYGAYLIIAFIATPSGFRDGWQLASGIVLVICAIVILASNATSVIVTFAIVLGIVALMIGINQIIGYSSLRGVSGVGFILVSGIINILLALFLLFAPIISTGVLGIVQGVYLCFAGIALVIEGFAKRPLSLN